jgi:hypothetical protein
MEQNITGAIIAGLLTATGLQTTVAEDYKTGTGIVLKDINPEGITVEARDQKHTIPGGAPFAMAQTEVSQGQFERLLGHNPAATDAEYLPVDRVTATEAAAFCKALTERDRAAGVLPKGKTYRLPTLREWLLAALPGGLIPSADAIGATAWHKDNSAGLLHPIGAKTANAYGLQDMIGNAAEWVTPDEALTKATTGGGPDQFVATTTLQVPGSGTLHQIGRSEETLTKPDYDAYIQTQYAVIKPRATIAPVVEQHGLDEADDLAVPRSTTPTARTEGVGFRFVLADK